MTTLQREALQMCLEYIETNAYERRHVRWKIQEALAQPAPVQEPVCHICKGTGEMDHGGTYPWGETINIPCECTTPPAAQRQWVGLTDEQRTEIRRENYARTLPLMEAVESKLKENNT